MGDVLEDERAIWIRLVTEDDEKLHLVLEGQELLQLVALLIMLGQTANIDDPEEDFPALIAPIPTQQFSYGPGRVPGESVLTMGCGLLTLSFSVETDTLVGLAEHLRKKGVRKGEGRMQ